MEERINYLNFDIRIESDQQGYTARVVNSPGGQGSAPFHLPFSDLELENFLLRVGRTRRGVRRLESPEMEAAKAFGGRLFDALFDDDVRGCLRSSLDEANRQGSGLRIRLRTADTPELADLPWEYLYNPTLNRFLVLSTATPVIRYLDLPERVRPLAVKPPLRVLVMISSPSDYPPLDVEQEWKKLRQALRSLEQRRLVTLERLEESTLIALQRRLRQGEYHIFHFVGHGGFDEQAQDGVLLLEEESGRGRPVSGQYLGTLMHDERTLRLAILNACEGARTSRTDPFAGAAQSLVQQGVPAVIAMQFEITDEAAITLAHEFYAALVDGYPVDAALAEARKAIFAQENDVEWGTPVLYMRARDGHIFDIEKSSEEERVESQVAALYQEAQAAMAEESWATAIERLQSVLDLDPAHAEATATLKQARQQQKLAALYAQGQEHVKAGRWREALDAFGQLRDISAEYKDVDALIATVESEVATEKTPAGLDRLLRFLPAQLNRWRWIAVPVAFALLFVILGGGFLIIRNLFFPPTPPLPEITWKTIGQSVEYRDLELAEIGNPGDAWTPGAVAIIGSIQGNQTTTTDLVQACIEYFDQDPQAVPPNTMFAFMPSLNPDGNASDSRYNANGVDLNRNWDTEDWRSDPAVPGYPNGKPGAGGAQPASEPETRALRNYLFGLRSRSSTLRVVILHSSVSRSHGEIYLGGDSAIDIAKAYAQSTGYNIKTEWADYTTSGELVTWCEEEGIPSIDIVIPASQEPSSRVSEEGTLLDITLQALLDVASYQ